MSAVRSIHAPDLDTAYTPIVVLARIVSAARSDGLLTWPEYVRASACVQIADRAIEQRNALASALAVMLEKHPPTGDPGRIEDAAAACLATNRGTL